MRDSLATMPLGALCGGRRERQDDERQRREGYFHTSGPWPLLQGHPEGMKMRRRSPWSDASALLGAAKEPVHTSVTQEPHRHPKLLCLRARTSDSLVEEAPPGGDLIFTSVPRRRVLGRSAHAAGLPS